MEFTAQTEYDIRYTKIEDKPHLLSWINQPPILHWMPPSNPKETDAFVEGWMAYARYLACLTATFKEVPVGMTVIYLMPYQKLIHHASFQIVVSPSYFRKGIGRSLLKNTMHLGKQRFRLERLSIDVLGENPILSLLDMFKFEMLTLQRHFAKEEGTYYSRRLMECLL